MSAFFILSEFSLLPQNAQEAILLAISGLAVAVFVLVGHSLFTERWESYEEQYMEDAGRTLDDLFLTIPPQQLMFVGVGMAFFLAIIGYVLLESIALSALLGLIGFVMPRKFLKIYRAKRVVAFGAQLVEALGTLNNGLRSGMSLAKSFSLVATEMPKPISQEFRILVQELRLGSEMEEAMRKMHKRVPSIDLDLLITAISISQSVGGNLTEVFEKIAHTIRERHRVEGRIDTLTAQGKMQGLVVGILPIALAGMIYVVAPDTIMPLFTTVPGYCLIAAICILEFLGFWVISIIVDIDV